MFLFVFLLMIVSVVLLYLGFLHLIGRRILMSARVHFMANFIIMGGTVFIVYLERSFKDHDLADLFPAFFLRIIIFVLATFLVATFFNKEQYVLLNSNKEEIKEILQQFLTEEGIKYKDQEDCLLLGATYADKIKYTNSNINLSQCSDLELKKLLIQHMKSKGKYGTRNIKIGMYIIVFALLLMFLAWRVFGTYLFI